MSMQVNDCAYFVKCIIGEICIWYLEREKVREGGVSLDDWPEAYCHCICFQYFSRCHGLWAFSDLSCEDLDDIIAAFTSLLSSFSSTFLSSFMMSEHRGPEGISGRRAGWVASLTWPRAGSGYWCLIVTVRSIWPEVELLNQRVWSGSGPLLNTVSFPCGETEWVFSTACGVLYDKCTWQQYPSKIRFYCFCCS